MAPKRASSKAAYPVPASWLESIEARRRRLRPDLFPSDGQAALTTSAAPVLAVAPPPARTSDVLGSWHTPSGGRNPAQAPSHSSSAQPVLLTRADAPVVRNCKRGSAADASSALAAHGIDELIADLRQD